jgi:hypothetical protein
MNLIKSLRLELSFATFGAKLETGNWKLEIGSGYAEFRYSEILWFFDGFPFVHRPSAIHGRSPLATRHFFEVAARFCRRL